MGDPLHQHDNDVMPLDDAPWAAVDDDRDDRRWADQALCKGKTHLFFPTRAERPQSRAKREALARQYCALCPVRTPCQLWGREHHEYGIWGGETEEERVLAGFGLANPIGWRTIKRVREARANGLADSA